jgi:hypothetical protein
LHPAQKSKLKKIKGLNIRTEVLKILQATIGKTFEYIGIHNNFLNMIPKFQEIRATTDK